ncbi:GMC family oxidoreductase N-terminal domain-containing protein [Marinobacter sp. tcs-11]|jgi:choline dehydrogenase|uniref:GMC family oxidoreductase n=1 Tax=Marinobacter sp. tcs-11 TaxID=1742860 RepID=UPI00257D463C|nr:GMC family oxidoreductase N-terminal domain-containing protein [Marinobacter sp. tcs-11]
MAEQVYDFIVCGSGASGGVVASQLAENPDVSVLLIEAGGDERVEQARDARIWMQNIGSERDWQFRSEPCAALNGRSPPLPMGKVLGGGSSVNGLVWARGHRNDFDSWASAADDQGWSYQSVLEVYKRIERWVGPADETRRGTEGPFYLTHPVNPNPVALALRDAADSLGIRAVDDLNGAAVEGPGAAGIPNVPVVGDSERVSVATAYIRPRMAQPNLTVMLDACVEQVLLQGRRASGVRLRRNGEQIEIAARHEVVLSLGAINTPKVLMLSGIGDAQSLAGHGIDLVQHLPGVGRNFQDHILVAGCCWEYPEPQPPRNNSAEFTFFAKSDPSLPTPDLQPMLEECAFGSEITRPQYRLPVDPSLAWTLAPGLVRPHSRGQVLLSGNRFSDPVRVEANFLSDERDVKALLKGIEICRELGNSQALRPFVKRELMPGPLNGTDMLDFLRNAAGTYFHQTCTAKMGTDEMSVVDGRLRVYGIEGLRIADGSIMPDITTGNTMAPCVLIGQRAADMLRADNGL